MDKLPSTYKALVLTARDKPLSVEERPMPQATSGSAVVRILIASLLPYSNEIYTGKRPYPFPTPIVPGHGAIGRIAALGPDATTLHVGDLVHVDIFVRARDDRDAAMLSGISAGGTTRSASLMEGEWRDSTFAEYAKLPLECMNKLPEPETIPGNPRLEELAYLSRLAVPYGGFRDINLKPGETCIVAPATGSYGGAAVEMALAMGAKVVAAGRNGDELARLEKVIGNPRLRTVKLTGDIEADAEAIGPASAFQDWSPPQAVNSPHLRACLGALKVNGRASLMGGAKGDVLVPYHASMRKNLKICFKWMYEPEDNAGLIEMAAAGLLDLRKKQVGPAYKLEEWQQAFDMAAKYGGHSYQVLFAP